MIIPITITILAFTNLQEKLSSNENKENWNVCFPVLSYRCIFISLKAGNGYIYHNRIKIYWVISIFMDIQEPLWDRRI